MSRPVQAGQPTRGTSGRALRWSLAALLALAVVLCAFAGWVAWRNAEPAGVTGPPLATDARALARGEYLARIGNCVACHTAPGGAPLAGGRGIATPFGTVYAPNLTPDADTGLGRWSADDFWRALHHGRSRDGRLLYPAFPYAQFTHMPRQDVDALYAWLRTRPPVRQSPPAPDLRFPYDQHWALAVWRALYFQAADQPMIRPNERHHDDPMWPFANAAGAYLVQSVAHCLACHGARNSFGGPTRPAVDTGSLLPDGWYAPSLRRADEAGVADWTEDEVVALLKTGHSPRGLAQGPMAEVVAQGTQYLTDDDAREIAIYLRRLARTWPSAPVASAVNGPAAAPPQTLALGRALYRQHCADCHGGEGQGAERRVYPPLAGNRMVTMTPPTNLLRVVLEGGFGAATPGHPQPYGMPPFAQTLTNGEIAALLTYLRQSWGNAAPPVSELDVLRLR